MQFHSLFRLVYPAHPHLISIQGNLEMNIKLSLLAGHRSNNLQYCQFIINYSPGCLLSKIFKLREEPGPEDNLQFVLQTSRPSLYPSHFFLTWKIDRKLGITFLKKIFFFQKRSVTPGFFPIQRAKHFPLCGEGTKLLPPFSCSSTSCRSSSACQHTIRLAINWLDYVIKNSSGIYESNHWGKLIAFYIPKRAWHTSSGILLRGLVKWRCHPNTTPKGCAVTGYCPRERAQSL